MMEAASCHEKHMERKDEKTEVHSKHTTNWSWLSFCNLTAHA
jgi:hypothetical protein